MCWRRPRCGPGLIEVRHSDGYAYPVDGPASCGLNFGYAMGASDVDGDGVHDLIVGVPGRASAGVPSSGAVALVPGQVAAGLDDSAMMFVDQTIDATGYSESPEPSGAFWSYWHTWSDHLWTPPGERMGSAVAI